MVKIKPYDELLTEIALAREAGDKTDELTWKAVLQSNYFVSEKQLEQEIKRLIKSKAKTVTERLTSFEDEVDSFFKDECEIKPKDRIVYLRDKAKNLGLNLRDTEIRSKIWEGRKRSKGLVTMLVPDMEIDAPQEIWLVEDLIMKSDTNLLIASPKVGKTTLVIDLIGKWSQGVDDCYLGKKFIGKCPPVLIVGTDMPRSRWLPLLNRFGLSERTGKDKWKLLNPIVGLFTQNESLHLDDSGLSRIGELVSKHEECLLLIDSYSKVVAPLGLKEADASFAGPIGDLQEVIAPFGVTLIVIHHSGKQSCGSGAVMASRGSTALPAAVSQVINLKWFNRDENRGDKRILLETEGRGISLEAIILQTQYGFESEGNAADVIQRQREKEKIAKLQDSYAEVFEEVKNRRPQEVTSGDIKNALKIGERSALRSLRALERKGLLISEKRRTDKGRCVVFRVSPKIVLSD